VLDGNNTFYQTDYWLNIKHTDEVNQTRMSEDAKEAMLILKGREKLLHHHLQTVKNLLNF
jgi:hypothetical protein